MLSSCHIIIVNISCKIPRILYNSLLPQFWSLINGASEFPRNVFLIWVNISSTGLLIKFIIPVYGFPIKLKNRSLYAKFKSLCSCSPLLSIFKCNSVIFSGLTSGICYSFEEETYHQGGQANKYHFNLYLS